MSKHVFHIPTIAHTRLNGDYFICAHTRNMFNFIEGMTERGHEVKVYGHEGESDTLKCSAYIPTLTEKEFIQTYNNPLQLDENGNRSFFEFSCTEDYAWLIHSTKAAYEIQQRINPGEFLLCFYGRCHKPIADSMPLGVNVVEPAVGYLGTFAPNKVYTSSAWMHFQRGRAYNNLEHWSRIPEEQRDRYPYDPVTMVSFETPEYQDFVIHPGFRPDEFEIAERKKDYYLCMSRITDNKGIQEAIELARAKGKQLIVAGPGDFKERLGMPVPSGVEHIGTVFGEKKKQLLSEAAAFLGMSRTMETFQFTAVEAMLSGTPPIVRPLGGPVETVVHGVTGFHARNYAQARQRLDELDTIDPHTCRQYAIDNFSVDVAMDKFEVYFDGLLASQENADHEWYETPDLDESVLHKVN